VLDLVLAALPQADGGALLLMHPQTGLFWTGAVTGLPAPSCRPFFESELGDAPDTFRRLAAVAGSPRALRRTGRGDNPILTDILLPHGYNDELRAVLTDSGVTWGGLSVWSRAGEFSIDDEEAVQAAAPAIAAILHDSVVSSIDSPGYRPGTVGVLVVEDGRVAEADVEDDALRRELTTPGFDQYRHIDHLLALSAVDPRFSTVLRTDGGGWLTAHGRKLGPGRAAIVISSAASVDLLGARVANAGLTPREIEVTRLLCRGLNDAEIAAALVVSPHTVHDHIRAIRRKLGVRSRAAVAALVFSESYLDGFLGSARIRHEQQV
jgi:DNA-binding CsgD family transcriptional regulator